MAGPVHDVAQQVENIWKGLNDFIAHEGEHTRKTLAETRERNAKALEETRQRAIKGQKPIQDAVERGLKFVADNPALAAGAVAKGIGYATGYDLDIDPWLSAYGKASALGPQLSTWLGNGLSLGISTAAAGGGAPVPPSHSPQPGEDLRPGLDMRYPWPSHTVTVTQREKEKKFLEELQRMRKLKGPTLPIGSRTYHRGGGALKGGRPKGSHDKKPRKRRLTKKDVVRDENENL